MTGSQTGIAFGSIFDKFDDGFRVMQILIIAFFMSSGVFVNVSKDHLGGPGDYFVYYMQYISPTRYGCELMMRKELDGRNKQISNIILNFLGYNWLEWKCYSFCVLYYIFMFLVGWLVLLWRSRKL